MIPDNLKKLFLTKYSSLGNEKFYRFLIANFLEKVVFSAEKPANPELELMDYHDKFLQLYKRENEEIYLDAAKQFRKAAHKIYRIMRKKGLTEKNDKFLNLVE